ncbi:EAL domain-containing protein [Acetobacter lovaniensis]|jgi:diguanylate cyclase (GGDEF)-like protein/PAS domain S-box-containing protein|uniref:Diguanylate cyclase (GGDEF)-like protein/PAS domain S-box-containing protein n=1 Tax=Acetobacter lovaniensis TaxID=104100 RepID=A0A841QE98_9PROT|nr:EAL domain-containing protein [Acetobacter lovaniensis]MBB6456725.1 diguanylate cyclase (GGDEF)-like protein/PAS domain S-box-containing protein [Acetobacter lovaniensis]MCI1794694.1 EAL domain-containing protein [Acetobacter lovaniensis]MCP1239310.1 EAL domain-containing protein [Acetobacter lovaniensis]NHN81457.1 EAL domain-containing protein [Acetobacter lovaniensis]GBQ65634.1 diguanylate cyclase/phosphodiesterase [Acetobacter lovaniensis NRIC 0474]
MPDPTNPFTFLNHVDKFYAAILEQATDGVVIIDDQNRIVFFNAAAEHLWGCPASAVLGNHVDQLVPMEHRKHHDDYIERHRLTGLHRVVNTSREVTFVRSNGDYVAAELSLSTALIGADNKRYYMAFIKGVTEEVHRRTLLELQSQVFAALADYTTIQDVADMLCGKVEQLVPNSIATLLHITTQGGLSILSGKSLPSSKINKLDNLILTASDIQDLRTNPHHACALIWTPKQGQNQHSDLHDCWASAICNAAGELIGIFALFSRNKEKITDWPQKIVTGCIPSCASIIGHEKTLDRINNFNNIDPLTGLLNRTALATRLRQMLAQPEQAPFAILMLDVDLLQDVNNVMGYNSGDILLQTIARRIAAFCRGHNLVARLGGDDFVVVMPDTDRNKACKLAHELNCISREPIEVKGRDLVASLSIGISLYPDDGTEIEEILGASETAMRQTKKQARGGFRFFGKGGNSNVRERLIIGSALRDALQKTQLHLVYQPQICALTGTLCGVEALSRWQHPTLGFIPPSTFIPIAEETGQIEAIGLWSLDKSCQQVIEWELNDVYVPVVSVNMSAVHFCSMDLPDQILSVLQKYNLAPQRLTIEITESVAMRQDPETAANLTAIRDIGVGLSMDDFGTGFSSLSRLAQLPLTEIKIDRSFIENFENDISSLVVAEAAINIGKRLGIKVVTEGVEHEAQETKLQQLGCDILQGYFYSRPLPANDMSLWLDAFPTRRAASPLS